MKAIIFVGFSLTVLASATSLRDAVEKCIREYQPNGIGLNAEHPQIDGYCKGDAAEDYLNAASKAFRYTERPYEKGFSSFRIFDNHNYCVYRDQDRKALGCYFELRLPVATK